MTRPKRKGSVFFLALGLFSVMIIFAFGISRRFSSQAQLITISDQFETTRYFLEAYVGDVLRQIRNEANKAESDIFASFRTGTAGRPLAFSYQPTALLKEAARRHEIEFIPGSPVLALSAMEPLKFPREIFEKVGANEEKKGFLEIQCRAALKKKTYSLKVKVPFKVVMRATPLLRDFILFCDRMESEQTRPFGTTDRINIVKIKDNRLDESFPGGLPLTLWPTPGKEADPEANGRVFLGPDGKKLFLNLVGGKPNPTARGKDLSDLWQISPKAFSANLDKEPFAEQELYRDQNNLPIKVLGMKIPLAAKGHFANMGLLGFSTEIADPYSNCLGESFKLETFLKGDLAFQEYLMDRGKMAFASALKLHGPNMSEDVQNFHGFPREIYGNVFARFLLISFFTFPSGGTPITHSANADQKLTFAQYGGIQKIEFKPKSGNYLNFMSRIVSGGIDSTPVSAESDIPLNVDQEGIHRILKAPNFPVRDGLKLRSEFANFAKAWFQPLIWRRGLPQIEEESVMERVSYFFQTQEEFKEYVGLKRKSPRFWIDGVVYINGDLDLREGFQTPDVRGGIVLVNGRITLGNVTRGVKDLKVEPTIRQEINRLSPEELLTFVSLGGKKITLTGDTHLGVQLISLTGAQTGINDQISWEKGSNIIFCGGLAFNSLNLERMTRQFLPHPDNPFLPYFSFVPAFSSAAPSFAVKLDSHYEGYEIVSQ